MKKILICTLFVVMALSTYIFVFNNKNVLNENNSGFKKDKTVDEYVDFNFKKMSLRDKISQMLILYYYSDTVSEGIKETIKDNKIGGFILFEENITSYEKTLKFVKELQNNSDIPLFISIDQEGGNVQRFNSLTDHEVTKIPYMYNLGLTNNEKLSYDVGRVMAEELRTIGVNMTFAPVIDIYSNKDNKVIGKRSFGSDKELVSKMAMSLSKELNGNGVISVYKHFPGHGDTSIDSHYNLPIINKTKEELLNNELVPFKKAIENNADVIMIGHLAVPKLTGDNIPASLSDKVITKLLKEELKFNGLVVTDALNMGALTKNYSTEEIYSKSINAGVDLLLMPGSSKKAIDTIENLVKNGKIEEEKINQSVKKILELKYKRLLKFKYLDSSYLNSLEHKEIISKIG